MKPLIIIQARSTSTRLPNKGNLLLINYHTVTDIILRRVARCGIGVVLALPEGDLLTKGKYGLWVQVVTGDKLDVLSRYYKVVRDNNHSPIIRITGDCPLVDPLEINRLLSIYMDSGFDYVSNAHPIRSVAKGFDVEIFSRNALVSAHFRTKSLEHREHVTSYIHSSYNYGCYSEPEVVLPTEDNLSIDTEEDYLRVKKLYKKLYNKYGFEFTMQQAVEEYLNG